MMTAASQDLVTLGGGAVLLGSLMLIRLLHALWDVAEDRLAPGSDVR